MYCTYIVVLPQIITYYCTSTCILQLGGIRQMKLPAASGWLVLKALHLKLGCSMPLSYINITSYSHYISRLRLTGHRRLAAAAGISHSMNRHRPQPAAAAQSKHETHLFHMHVMLSFASIGLSSGTCSIRIECILLV